MGITQCVDKVTWLWCVWCVFVYCDPMLLDIYCEAVPSSRPVDSEVQCVLLLAVNFP